MDKPTRILLKLTGTILIDKTTGKLNTQTIMHIIDQIKRLSTSYQFGIVIGGGSFFRGSVQGKSLGLTEWTGHSVGMLATVMNGLILRDLMVQQGVATSLLTATECSNVAPIISQQSITTALDAGNCIIFSGGTGVPYFTTDTNAVIRALQMDAFQLWKCTGVDGIYDSDPLTNPHACLLKTISIKQALCNRLNIMDMTALSMAQEHNLSIRILNIFNPDTLMQASQDQKVGSLIHP
jgi:uridylate kinase